MSIVQRKGIDERQEYTWTDRAKMPGYYRIKVLLMNGEEVYSQVLSVRGETQGSSLKVYPNPVENDAVFSFYSEKEQEASLTIYEASGKKLFSKNYHFTKGPNTVFE